MSRFSNIPSVPRNRKASKEEEEEEEDCVQA
jgi:hypothetical protein